MAKLTLSNLGTLNDAVATVNTNNGLIETALENTLSRDGTSPNTMSAHLDMNGFSIFNQGTITTSPNGNQLVTGDATFQGDITQTATAGIWVDALPGGVNIARFDRAFVGTAESATGNSYQINHQGTWLDTSTQGANWIVRDSQLLSMARIGTIAVGGISRSSDQNTDADEAIGLAGFCVNDKTSGLAWASYLEVQHESGATASYGAEIDLKNKGSNITNDPYTAGGQGTYGLWIVAGGDVSYGGSPTNPSTAAIDIRANASTWNSGIVFQNTSITGTDGTTGTGIAIDMAKGHTIRWLKSGSQLGASIRSDVGTTGKDVQMIFSDDQFAVYSSGGHPLFAALRTVATPVNYVTVFNSATGVAPSISSSLSSDTNVDLTLSAKGTGVVRSDNPMVAPINLAISRTVNFNSANTDNSMTVVLPTGYTRYRINQLLISGASASISTANFGLFTAAAAGGTAIIPAGTAITVTSSAEATNNNMMVSSPANQNTQSFNNSTLFFRVGTAQGSAATANVTILISPVS